jgi:hypothetical protein
LGAAVTILDEDDWREQLGFGAGLYITATRPEPLD